MSYAVVSPFPQRSGIMFVKPPGHLGTTILDIVSSTFPNMLLVSDLNSNNLTAMHESLFSGKYRTIAFKDMIKLYERNANAAANVEGTLRAMVEEGWTGATAKDMRIAAAPVRIMVMGAMTPKIYGAHLPAWIDTGFARRFLWCHYKLEHPEVVGDAIEEQKLRVLEAPSIPNLQNGNLQFNLDSHETRRIRIMMRNQEGVDGSPFNLLLKIATVLKWKYSKQKNGDYMQVLTDFSRLLQNTYVEVSLP
jgi:hypothetical protein